MFKFIVSLFVAMGISGPATGDHTKVTVGWLIGFNKLADEVYLHDGKTFKASPRTDFSILEPGERFFIEYEETKSRKNIISIIPVPVMDERLLTSIDD